MNALDLKKIPIFSELTDAELNYLAQYVSQESFSSNEEIIREGDQETDIYLVVDGEVVIVKKNASEREHEIRRLGSGNVFGEMAIIDREPRSATVRAVGPTRALRLPLEKLDIPDVAASTIYDKILSQIARTSLQNIRSTNQDYVASLQEHISNLNMQNQFGIFFVCTLALYSIQTVLTLYFPLESGRYSLEGLSWVRLLMLLVPTLFLARYLHFSLKNFGLTWTYTKVALCETVSLLAVAFVGGWAYAYFAHFLPEFKAHLMAMVVSWFSWHTLVLLLYILAFEFVIRGVIQTSLQRYLHDDKGYIAVFLTANFLWLLNLYMGLYQGGIRFLMDIFLGAVYVRHQTLIGVVILHFVITTFAYLYY